MANNKPFTISLSGKGFESAKAPFEIAHSNLYYEPKIIYVTPAFVHGTFNNDSRLAKITVPNATSGVGEYRYVYTERAYLPNIIPQTPEQSLNTSREGNYTNVDDISPFFYDNDFKGMYAPANRYNFISLRGHIFKDAIFINKNAILYIGRDLRSQGHNYSGNMGVFIGTDDEWEKLDNTLPSGGVLY